LPFHKYAGPGTHIRKNIENNVKPTTFLDKAALVHDIEYLKPNQEFKADLNLIKNTFKKGKIKSIPILPQLTSIMLLKNLLGLKLSNDDSTNYESVKQDAILKGLADESDFMDHNN